MKIFDGENLVAFICLIIVVFMIIGCVVFIIKQLLYNFKFTAFIFISVVAGIILICGFNYLKNFH